MPKQIYKLPLKPGFEWNRQSNEQIEFSHTVWNNEAPTMRDSISQRCVFYCVLRSFTNGLS